MCPPGRCSTTRCDRKPAGSTGHWSARTPTGGRSASPSRRHSAGGWSKWRSSTSARHSCWRSCAGSCGLSGSSVPRSAGWSGWWRGRESVRMTAPTSCSLTSSPRRCEPGLTRCSRQIQSEAVGRRCPGCGHDPPASPRQRCVASLRSAPMRRSKWARTGWTYQCCHRTGWRGLRRSAGGRPARRFRGWMTGGATRCSRASARRCWPRQRTTRSTCSTRHSELLTAPRSKSMRIDAAARAAIPRTR